MLKMKSAVLFWFNTSVILVIVHLALLLAFYGTNLPNALEGLLNNTGLIKLPVLSRWCDLLILPVVLAILMYLWKNIKQSIVNLIYSFIRSAAMIVIVYVLVALFFLHFNIKIDVLNIGLYFGVITGLIIGIINLFIGDEDGDIKGVISLFCFMGIFAGIAEGLYISATVFFGSTIFLALRKIFFHKNTKILHKQKA